MLHYLTIFLLSLLSKYQFFPSQSSLSLFLTYLHYINCSRMYDYVTVTYIWQHNSNITHNPNPKFWDRQYKKWKEIKIRNKMKIIQVHCFQFWYYPPFKVSPLEKLTSIFASSSLTSLDIYPQTFCYPIYITSLLYTFLATPSS